MRRLAGPDLKPSEEVVASALHDRHKFVVEKFEDWILDDGDAELLVRWKNHTDDERTWEPLEQLMQDVPELVRKYITSVGNTDLQSAYEECLAGNSALNNLEKQARAADDTNDNHAAAGRRSDKAAQRSTTAVAKPPPNKLATANAARDRRAAKRNENREKC